MWGLRKCLVWGFTIADVLWIQVPMWGFPEMGVPQNGWFTMENPTKMDDDWGYPYFRKPQVGGQWILIMGPDGFS